MAARVVPAVGRALSILELFLDGRVELTPRDITNTLGLPRTTVHELTHTLVELGYMRRSPDGRGFRLGPKVLQLGSAYAERLDLAVEGRAVAEEVGRKCDETVHVAVLDHTDVVYVVKVDSTRAVRMVSGVGRRVPAHNTAGGKMLLSPLGDAEIDALYQGVPLNPLTPNSVTSMAGVKAALNVVRANGVAFESMESSPDVSCVAAPVYDHTGTMAAALSISVPVARWHSRTDDDWAEMAGWGARELSARLGAPA